jgi:hypothetical protein
MGNRTPSARKNRPVLSAIFVLCIVTPVYGCFGSKVKPYPDPWPPLAIDPSRPCDIAGLYSVEPDAAHELPRPLRRGEGSAWEELVDVVEGGMEGVPYVDHTSLRIREGRDDAGEFLDVSAERANGVVSSRRLREGKHYRCTQEGLEITRGWYGVNINVGIAFLKYRHVFHKDPQDGALVLHMVTQERGLVLWVVPVWGSGESWIRWPLQ